MTTFGKGVPEDGWRNTLTIILSSVSKASSYGRRLGFFIVLFCFLLFLHSRGKHVKYSECVKDSGQEIEGLQSECWKRNHLKSAYWLPEEHFNTCLIHRCICHGILCLKINDKG